MKTLFFLLSFNGTQLFTLLIVIGISIAVFLFLREFFIWYWKIKELLKRQDAQIELLKKIEENTRK